MEASQPEHFRLFVAISLPEQVKTQIEIVQRELRRLAADASIRWTSREQFHLTLKFLGGVEANRAPNLLSALQAACASFAPLQLRAEGIGFFPDPMRPRVIWVRVGDLHEQLLPLQRAVETATRDFTVEPAENHFSGHITLGRIKFIGRPDTGSLASAAARMNRRSFGRWTAGAIVLFRSELSSQGARHIPLASIGLPP